MRVFEVQGGESAGWFQTRLQAKAWAFSLGRSSLTMLLFSSQTRVVRSKQLTASRMAADCQAQ